MKSSPHETSTLRVKDYKKRMGLTIDPDVQGAFLTPSAPKSGPVHGLPAQVLDASIYRVDEIDWPYCVWVRDLDSSDWPSPAVNVTGPVRDRF